MRVNIRHLPSAQPCSGRRTLLDARKRPAARSIGGLKSALPGP